MLTCHQLRGNCALGDLCCCRKVWQENLPFRGNEDSTQKSWPKILGQTNARFQRSIIWKRSRRRNVETKHCTAFVLCSSPEAPTGNLKRSVVTRTMTQTSVPWRVEDVSITFFNFPNLSRITFLARLHHQQPLNINNLPRESFLPLLWRYTFDLLGEQLDEMRGWGWGEDCNWIKSNHGWNVSGLSSLSRWKLGSSQASASICRGRHSANRNQIHSLEQIERAYLPENNCWEPVQRHLSWSCEWWLRWQRVCAYSRTCFALWKLWNSPSNTLCCSAELRLSLRWCRGGSHCGQWAKCCRWLVPPTTAHDIWGDSSEARLIIIKVSIVLIYPSVMFYFCSRWCHHTERYFVEQSLLSQTTFDSDGTLICSWLFRRDKLIHITSSSSLATWLNGASVLFGIWFSGHFIKVESITLIQCTKHLHTDSESFP